MVSNTVKEHPEYNRPREKASHNELPTDIRVLSTSKGYDANALAKPETHPATNGFLNISFSDKCPNTLNRTAYEGTTRDRFTPLPLQRPRIPSSRYMDFNNENEPPFPLSEACRMIRTRSNGAVQVFAIPAAAPPAKELVTIEVAESLPAGDSWSTTAMYLLRSGS